MSILNRYPIRFALLGCAIIIFALGFWLGARKSGPLGRAFAQDVSDTAQPAVIRQDGKIIIPEGSALRSRLVVQPVEVKNSPRVVQLPAAVEADPAHTVNILPPVAGKVVKLDVQLGDQVKKDQPLAVIDSGDLAQAYADDDKARSALKRAQSSLDRVRGVHEAGGGPLRMCSRRKTILPRRRPSSTVPKRGSKRSACRASQRQVAAPDPHCAHHRKRHGPHDRLGRIRKRSDRLAHDDFEPRFCLGHCEWCRKATLPHIAKGQSVDVSFPPTRVRSFTAPFHS